MPQQVNKILFLIPYPLKVAPSQRFRFEQYLHELQKLDFQLRIKPFLNLKGWEILYKDGKTIYKVYHILRGFASRIRSLFHIFTYDFIFVHREAAPIGPPIFEWTITKVFKKRIIYDFDDAIWLPNTSIQNKIAARLKWHSKIKNICHWSYKISCGNQYLCTFASQFNNNIVYNPTTIDTKNLHNPSLYQDFDHNNERIIIGWTGTHSTMPYLNLIIPVLQKLEDQYEFELMVISNLKPSLPLKNVRFKSWKAETEIEDLIVFDIGIMPLPDNQWAMGKCGFKAIQYMALEIPAVASAIGANIDIMDDGVDGYLCHTNDEWYKRIEQLILRPDLRKKIGKNGRRKIIENYSVASNKETFLSFFE